MSTGKFAELGSRKNPVDHICSLLARGRTIKRLNNSMAMIQIPESRTMEEQERNERLVI